MDDGLRDILDKKVENAEKGIKGALLEWGSAVVSGNYTLGDVLESQVRFQAKRQKKTVQKIVDFLFETEDSETFLLRLQS